jgi:hypothetical protein
MIQDSSADTSAFVAFKFKSDGGANFDGVASDLTMTNTGTSLRIQTPVTNTPTASYFYYGEYGRIQTTVDPDNLYRVTASVTAPGGSANASIILALNARGNAGYGLMQTNSGAAGGPTATASSWSAFLLPLEAGTPQAQFIVYDSTSATGGLVEASDISVQNIKFTDLLASASVVQATSTSFPVSSTGAATATEWGYFDAPFGAVSPTFSHTPANGASGPLVLSAATATDNFGLASFQGPTASIPTTAGKLVLIRTKLSTSSSASAVLPTIWLNTEAATIQSGTLIQRDIAGTSGPTSSPDDYYVVFEAKDAVCAFNLRILADAASINGNVQMTELEVLEADMPLEP